jgi:hypothetical protein
MGRTAPVRVPAIKVRQAREVQKDLATKGIFLPLYQCLYHVDKKEQGSEDYFRRFRL